MSGMKRSLADDHSVKQCGAQTVSGPAHHTGGSSAIIFFAMRSERAEIVNEGFTPSAVGMIDPSATYKPLCTPVDPLVLSKTLPNSSTTPSSTVFAIRHPPSGWLRLIDDAFRSPVRELRNGFSNLLLGCSAITGAS